MSTTRHEILFKHSMSGAHDALTEFSIDHDRRIIEVRQRRATRTDFVSTALLESLIFEHLPGEGIVAYHDDAIASWQPTRTEWRVFLGVGRQRFRVDGWNQRPSSGTGTRRCIELHPVKALDAGQPCYEMEPR